MLLYSPMRAVEYPTSFTTSAIVVSLEGSPAGAEINEITLMMWKDVIPV